jgi:glycosyltransferase involved in cell wall biosynthesis
LRILIYSSNSIYSGKPVGGAEHSLSLLAKGIAEEGEEVCFLTRSSTKRFVKSRVGVIDGVKVHFLPNFSIPLQRIKSLRKFNEWIFKRTLFFYLNKYFKSFDVALVYNEYPDLYYIQKWKNYFNLDIKTVIRVAGFYWHYGIGVKSNKFKKIISEVYNSVDAVNFISTSLEKKFWTLNSDYKYKIVIHNSFVLDIGVPSPKLLAKKTDLFEFQIIMVARFSKLSKNQEMLIQAFEYGYISNSKLVLIGEGETKEALVSYCKNNEFLSSRVVFTGYINKDAINEYLRASSLFCLCSDYEGVPKASLEAMYAGLPILVSNIAAYEGIVIDNCNGFLVENTVAQWGNKILEIHQYYLSNSLGEITSNAKAFVAKNYDYRINSLRYQVEFKKLVE